MTSEKNHLPCIAVVLPVFNRKDVTLQCLSTLHSFSKDRYTLSIVVVDDGSTDGTGTALKEHYPEVAVIYGDGNLWWAGGVNRGLEYVKNNITCEYILLMNDDSHFNQQTLDELFNYAVTTPDSCVSAIALLAGTNTIYCAGHAMSGRYKNCLPLYQGKARTIDIPNAINCDSLSSRFVLMPYKIIETVGLFDCDKFPHGYSDIDYFLRAKASGYSNIVLTASVVFTQLNLNYLRYSFANMSRMQYLQSLRSNKCGNNIKLVFYSSLMHRDNINGLLLLTRNILSAVKLLLIKMMLPRFIANKLIRA